jgi:hypothetical protein
MMEDGAEVSGSNIWIGSWAKGDVWVFDAVG